MPSNPHVTVHVDLNRIRENVRAIAQLAKVPILAVVKSDAYGLGAPRIAETIADLVDGFCVFSLAEAVESQLHQRAGKRILALGPPGSANPGDFIAAGVTPAVSTIEQAAALREAHPLLCVDTGMQRFSCPTDQIDAALKADDCREAFTHATRVEHAIRLQELAGGRGLRLHAAATSLLHEPEARLDAVRPGLAIYRGAVRVVTRIVEAHDSTGPAGYGGFVTPRHGVVLAGYSSGLRPGFCSVNGAKRRVIEVGMQSSFIELGSGDRAGDEVCLLDQTVPEDLLAEAWGGTPHQVMLMLCAAETKRYAS